MSWMQKMILGGMILRAPEGDGGSGGGGAGGAGNAGAGGTGGGKGAGDPAAGKGAPDLSTVLARLDALEKENKELKAKGAAGADDDQDLADKARKEREAREKSAGDSKQLEKALAFTMGSKEWLKTNESLLPKSVAGIFEQAEKENYGSALEKASAIKVGMIQEFFSLQENLDLLTDSQKSALEDFRKLTKNDKAERVQNVYDMIFEPAFKTLKSVKKAEQLGKGLGTPSDADAAYRAKMQSISKKTYLREKGV